MQVTRTLTHTLTLTRTRTLTLTLTLTMRRALTTRAPQAMQIAKAALIRTLTP